SRSSSATLARPSQVPLNRIVQFSTSPGEHCVAQPRSVQLYEGRFSYMNETARNFELLSASALDFCAGRHGLKVLSIGFLSSSVARTDRSFCDGKREASFQAKAWTGSLTRIGRRGGVIGDGKRSIGLGGASGESAVGKGCTVSRRRSR